VIEGGAQDQERVGYSDGTVIGVIDRLFLSCYLTAAMTRTISKY
jgi:hypothetical protein